MATLFEYNNMIDEIMAKATNEDGEIDEDLIRDELEKLELERAEKIDNCIAYFKSRKAMGEALKAEKKSIEERQRAAERQAENMKRYIALCLQGEKYESLAGKVSYRKTQSVQYEDIMKIPEEYLKYTPSVDKTKIKEDIKAGVIVDGAWIEEKTSTSIK